MDASTLEAINCLKKCVTICNRLRSRRWRHPDAPLLLLLFEQIDSLTTEVHNLLQLSDAMLSNSMPPSRLLSLFALTHILNLGTDGDNTHRPFVGEEKYARIGRELLPIMGSLQRVFVPTYGADQPFENVRLGRTFDQMRPIIEPFLERVWEQLRPRYIHHYETHTDIPFIQDETSETFSGSFGIVQKVTHKKNQDCLARKTFRGIFSSKDENSILKEIGLLEVCFHKNIVRYVEAYRVADEDHIIHVVLRPWAPYTLTDFLRSSNTTRKKQCPWFEPNDVKSDRCVYRIMYELTDGLSYLHRKAIKHKGLKPDNILFHQEKTNHVTPLITDMGNSKAVMMTAKTKYIDSTYQYLAPEQHERTGSTMISDIWQLGCCFAEFLAVAVGGTSGYVKLYESYNRDDEECACSIATEHAPFMETLGQILRNGDAAQITAYRVVVGMLELDPSRRLDLTAIKHTLSGLIGMTTA